MFAHSFQDSHLGFICLRNWLRSFVLGSLNPHIFAKTLFSFQGTTCCFKTAFLFCQILLLLSSTFFWLVLPSYRTAFIILLKQLSFVNCFCLIFLTLSSCSCLAAHCPTTVINTSKYFSFLQVFFAFFWNKNISSLY